MSEDAALDRITLTWLSVVEAVLWRFFRSGGHCEVDLNVGDSDLKDLSL